MKEQPDTNSIAFQYIREQVAKDMAPLYAIFNKEPQMNERIKQIAEESGLYIAYDNRAVTDKELEFFAKLIVRECLNKIENEAAQYAEPVWAFELVNDIKEHFGVE